MKDSVKILFIITAIFITGFIFTKGYLCLKTKYETNRTCPPFPKNKYLFYVNEKKYYTEEDGFNENLQDTIYSYIKHNKLYIRRIFNSGGFQYSQHSIDVKDDTLYLIDKACGDEWTEITQYDIIYKIDVRLKSKIIRTKFLN